MSSKKGKQLANKKPIKLTEERRRRLMSQKYAYSLLCNNMIVPPHVFAAMARDSEYEQSLEIYAKIYGCELDNTINSLKFLQASLKSSLSSTPETNSASTSSTLITTNYTTTNSSITNFIPILPEVLIKAQEQAELGAIEIRNRINERIKALENLPANLSNGPLKQRLTFDDNKRPASNPKLNAVIELKALRLYDFQQKIRNEIMQYSPMYRRPQGLDEILQYRRPKERFEYTWSYFHRREQDRIQKKINEEKAKRQKFFFQISAMYADYITISELMREKKLALGMAVLNYHSSVQKEQQRKQDKFQRERLNALKNDDEEAYMKLIDETKDTRLSHLLKQTDQYLESLAKAVSSQQNQNFDNNSTINAHNGPSISLSSSVIDEDNIIETRDGKKIDYYQVAHRIKEERQNGPFLIIVPLSTLTNWMVELEKWAPDINKVVYKGTINERRSIQQRHLKHIDFQVFLTTYEYVIKDKQQLGKNNLPELWSLLNFVLPKIFDSLESFDEWFNTPFANTGGQDKIALNEEETLLIIRRLHKVLRPFLLRRLKKDVESELPDKIEKIIKVKLSALQIKLYNQMKTHGAIFVNKGEKGKTGIKGLNNTIMQLRKICNHPFVFKEVEKDINKSNSNNEYLYRILVFFQMTTIMDIMQDYFEWRGYSFLRLDGTTKSEDRTKLLGQFNAPASPYSIFMNPHQDLQAQDRAHRIGQKNEVKILRLISQKSIEENILARAQYKLDIDGKVIQAGKFDHKSTAQEREDYLIDEEREKIEEREWLSSGSSSVRKGRLIEEHELPPLYLAEHEKIIKAENVEEYGRGQRQRKEVLYDDGLTEDQYLKVSKDDEDNEGEEPEVKEQEDDEKPKKKIASDARSIRKAKQKATEGIHNNIQEELTTIEELKNMKKRSRRKRVDVKIGDDEDDNEIEENNRNVASSSSSSSQKIIQKDFKKQMVDQSSSIKMKKVFHQCIVYLESFIDKSDEKPRKRAELFLDLPNRKEYPSYYKVIKKPVSLNLLRKRINRGHYKSYDEFSNDMTLMFDNARTFNEDGSEIYQDANILQEAFNAKFTQLVSNNQDSR
ncbi:20979_t:CDS:10 [Entrophospora sp. SA101]|nr:20979_t:CDS:10 [Entrophospora sp. SA101]